jgi:hypothetical protein
MVINSSLLHRRWNQSISSPPPMESINLFSAADGNQFFSSPPPMVINSSLLNRRWNQFFSSLPPMVAVDVFIIKYIGRPAETR